MTLERDSLDSNLNRILDGSDQKEQYIDKLTNRSKALERDIGILQQSLRQQRDIHRVLADDETVIRTRGDQFADQMATKLNANEHALEHADSLTAILNEVELNQSKRSLTNSLYPNIFSNTNYDNRDSFDVPAAESRPPLVTTTFSFDSLGKPSVLGQSDYSRFHKTTHIPTYLLTDIKGPTAMPDPHNKFDRTHHGVGLQRSGSIASVGGTAGQTPKSPFIFESFLGGPNRKWTSFLPTFLHNEGSNQYDQNAQSNRNELTSSHIAQRVDQLDRLLNDSASYTSIPSASNLIMKSRQSMSYRVDIQEPNRLRTIIGERHGSFDRPPSPPSSTSLSVQRAQHVKLVAPKTPMAIHRPNMSFLFHDSSSKHSLHAPPSRQRIQFQEYNPDNHKTPDRNVPSLSFLNDTKPHSVVSILKTPHSSFYNGMDNRDVEISHVLAESLRKPTDFSDSTANVTFRKSVLTQSLRKPADFSDSTANVTFRKRIVQPEDDTLKDRFDFELETSELADRSKDRPLEFSTSGLRSEIANIRTEYKQIEIELQSVNSELSLLKSKYGENPSQEEIHLKGRLQDLMNFESQEAKFHGSEVTQLLRDLSQLKKNSLSLQEYLRINDYAMEKPHHE